MNNNRSFSHVIAGGIAGLALLSAGTASAVTIANPAPLAANASVTVPAYNDSAGNYVSNPQVSISGYCLSTGCTTGVLGQAVPSGVLESALLGSGSFLEVAATTNLNPFGANDLSFGFFVGGSAASNITSITLPGFGTYSTDVQSCNGEISVDSIAIPCNGTNVSAQRDSSGNITFAAQSGTFPTSSWTLPPFDITSTDGFAIYTNAPVSALIDPTVTVTYADGVSQPYPGLGLSAPTPPPSVPEPASLGLLAAGLAGLAIALGRRRLRLR